MASFQNYPEMLAGFTFLPLGVSLHYLIHYTMSLIAFNPIIPGDIYYGPLCLTIGCAALVGIIQTSIKLVKKKYVFENFYIMMVGMALLIVGGALMTIVKDIDSDLKLLFRPSYYVVAAGLGITYVPALTYVNIRVTTNKFRTFKIALCHCWFLIGFAIGAVAQTTMFMEDTTLSEILRIIDTTVNYGYIMIAFALFTFIGYIINESLQFFVDEYNYKVHLDTQLDRQNNYGDLMNRYWFESADQTKFGYNEMRKQPQQNTVKLAFVTTFLILSKVQSLIYFYPFFMYFNNSISLSAINHTTDYVPYSAFLLGVGGVLISTITLIFFSVRIGYFLSCGLKIISVVMITVVVKVSGIAASETVILVWIGYAFFSFGYSHPDINTLELVGFKFNELIITVGFIVELAIITVIHYYTLVDINALIPSGVVENFEIILPHAIFFIVICAFLGISSAIALPNTFRLSLIDIKNLLAGIQPDKNQSYPPQNRYPINYNLYPVNHPKNTQQYPDDKSYFPDQHGPENQTSEIPEWKPQQDPRSNYSNSNSAYQSDKTDPHPDYPPQRNIYNPAMLPSSSQTSTVQQSPISRPHSVQPPSSQKKYPPPVGPPNPNFPPNFSNSLEYDWSQIKPASVLPRLRIGPSYSGMFKNM